jgi:hypothetical protein
MPEPKPEEPGTAPFQGAEWTAGYWSWDSGDWAWQDGGWTDPTLFDEGGTVGIVGVDVSPGPYANDGHTRPAPGIRDHRRIRDRVRDHRDLDNPPSSSWQPTSRDSSSSSHTRDHRDSSSTGDSARSGWTPSNKDSGATVRDHRKDDDKKDDDKPHVRDHR